MATVDKTEPARLQAQDIDWHVGTRIRERRIMLGLSQQQMGDLIGVTYQQAARYEQGVNRVAAGRLAMIAQALGVETSYFFEGLEGEHTLRSTEQRLFLELARNFIRIPDRKQQQAVCEFARTMASSGLAGDQDPNMPSGERRGRALRSSLQHKGSGSVSQLKMFPCT